MPAQLQHTTGLVLHTTRYGETSVIAKVFTRQLGVRSYIVKGVRSTRSRAKQNLLQPLSFLDMVVYDTPRAEINYIKEMGPARHWQSLDAHPAKAALRFFASEALYKSLREAEPAPEMFDYVIESLDALDSDHIAQAAYPLAFLLGLSRHLGIEPLDNYSQRDPCFNPAEGRFQPPSKLVPQLSSQDSFLLHHYIEAARAGDAFPIAPLAQRQTLLRTMIDYYQIHLSDFKNFKSHEVLHGVLR